MTSPILEQTLPLALVLFPAPESLEETLSTLPALYWMLLKRTHSSEEQILHLQKWLLKKGKNTPTSYHASFLNHPLFQLDASSRWVLSAFHILKWPYQKLASFLKTSPSQIAHQLWELRFQLFPEMSFSTLPHSSSCPLPPHPLHWSGAFLDHELSKKEAFQFQNHLPSCTSCSCLLEQLRPTLTHTQKLLESYLESQKKKIFIKKLEKNFKTITFQNQPLSWKRSWILFFKKPFHLFVLLFIITGSLMLFFKN